MTVIAWDGKTLAADKLACNGSTKSTTTKIFRHDDCLLAVTGNLSIGMEMVNWARSGYKPEEYPASNRNLNEGCSLIKIEPNGDVWKYESAPFPFKLEGRFLAFGSGDECAYVAMHCGATAAEAVAATSLFNTGCGNGIDTLEFE